MQHREKYNIDNRIKYWNKITNLLFNWLYLKRNGDRRSPSKFGNAWELISKSQNLLNEKFRIKKTCFTCKKSSKNVLSRKTKFHHVINIIDWFRRTFPPFLKEVKLRNDSLNCQFPGLFRRYFEMFSYNFALTFAGKMTN